jgi:TonB family protein
MPDNILLVEYEPRYSDRVRQALAALPVGVSLARDGEEAAHALMRETPRLVILSSVIPKGNSADIIRAVRAKSDNTPILLTISGYNGTAPAQDAARMGATDILRKPFTEAEILSKVQGLLGIQAGPQLTSADLFGDMVDERPAPKKPAAPAAAKDDLDKFLADRLGTKPKTMPGVATKAKTAADVDKLVHDTLSGLEKKKTATKTPIPTTAPAAAPAPARSPQAAVAEITPDRVPVSQPVFAPQPPLKDEPEPADGKGFGQYVLLEKIATGGMAEVWKARKKGEEGFQKIVAIKKILPHLSDNQDFIEMFIDEAKLAAQLNHNNIIHIYDLGKIANSYFIAMEYIEGADLKAILRQAQDRDQPLGVELSLFIGSKIAAALDYAHRKRDFDQKDMELVHRDVSPQNVLISHDGDIKLCDFGIAKAASKASHTQAGALKGKLQYMSPEQAWGTNIDRRSDIFALGAVLFEMLTGRKLFTGDSEISILEQVRSAKITDASSLNEEVTPEIDRILQRALQKDPANRYQTAADMARDIDAVLYSFRPTPTSADLAIFMHRIWTPEPARPALHGHEEAPTDPMPQRAATPTAPAAVPAAAAKPVTSPGVSMPAWESAKAAHPKKRSLAVPLGIAALLIVGLAAGGFFYFRSRPAASEAATAAAVPAATVPVDTAPAQPVQTTTMVPAPTLVATATTGTAAVPQPAPLDPSLVDQEVQRRLAAERTRLEQQALAQQQAAARQQQAQTQTAAPPRPAPQVATQTVAPPPVEVPPPTVTVPTQTVAEAAPAPAPATETAPAQPRFRQGDLVQQGTEGLTPARVIRLGTVPYPPMARQRRVQGTVLMSVLVSESGQVLETRVLKGIAQPVGLNEAAEQVIRRSTFSAPMMRDGTRVKAWATVPVKFEL